MESGKKPICIILWIFIAFLLGGAAAFLTLKRCSSKRNGRLISCDNADEAPEEVSFTKQEVSETEADCNGG